MRFRPLGWLLAVCLFTLRAAADSGLPATAPDLIAARWPARWITAPAAPRADAAVILLRRAFTLATVPDHFVVHVSADARYRLWVNGRSIAIGPQWSAAPLWRYESLDLAPFLQAGKNVITARVRSYGDDGPLASMGRRLGFILQGDTAAERGLDTGPEWRAWHDTSTTPRDDQRAQLHTYFALAPAERHDGNTYPWGWQLPQFDDAAWAAPLVLGPGMPAGYGAEDGFWLSPRTTPLQEEMPERFQAVRRATLPVPAGFAAGGAPFQVPARTAATVLLDQGHLTSAFPQLTVTGGHGARIRVAYAEALVDAAHAKGPRDAIEGRELRGITDEFLPDGGAQRRFATDDYRTYRFVELQISTGDEPLTIDDFHGVFVGYPFRERGAFSSDDPRLTQVWNVGWRTARLCAAETYMDCPYYEQLQYVGDTRIQALVSLYVSGDDRLMRNAIELFDRSRTPEGITQSRYPSASAQLIPTFSLFWIDMVHDYWRHRDDPAFIAARLAGIDSVIGWYERHLNPSTGLLGPLPYWPFVDWVGREQWPEDKRLALGGVPPGGRDGGSSVITLQFAYTLRHAAQLYAATGRPDDATRCEQLASRLCAAVNTRCWNPERRLYADTPDQRTYSQHANTMAVLAGAVRGNEASDLMQRIIADPSLAQATIYFRFYLLRALKVAGLGDRYLDQLGPWHAMLARGLTTFAEKEDPTRSDCHAWSASPLYELLATVCGIEPAAPGFATVRIEPHLGKLQRAEGRVPHPRGDIVVQLERRGSGVHAEISLPEGITGEFVWQGGSHALQAGKQTVDLR